MSSVGILGMSHLGCVTAACFAKLGHKVIGYDNDAKVIADLRQCKPPIFEPGLEETIRAAAGQDMIGFTTDIASAVSKANFAYVALDTPVDGEDKADIRPVEILFDKMLHYLSGGAIVLLSSQVPIGTSRGLLDRLRKENKENGLCYIPENLRLGTAIERFLSPERTVFGLSSPELRQRVEELYAGIPGERLYMSLESAEMAKHALNSYLATMISFSCEISDLCEKTGANALDVMHALRTEKRVSPQAPIAPGLGFGGGTLARDIQMLRSLGREHAVPTRVFDAVLDTRNARLNYVPGRLRSILGTLSGKGLAFFGLTYKPNTDTLKRSLALQIIDQIACELPSVRAYDPAIRGKIATHPNISICGSPQEAAIAADAIIITTPWDEFSRIDYAAIAKLMRNPVMLDTTNSYADKVKGHLEYHGIGVDYAR
jgi:UDPglucose 6-dehydrogenase